MKEFKFLITRKKFNKTKFLQRAQRFIRPDEGNEAFCFLSSGHGRKEKKGHKRTEQKDGHWIISCRRTYCICKCHCSVTTRRLVTFTIVYVGTYTILEKFSDIHTIKDHMLARVKFGKIAANTKLVNTQIEEICRN